MTKYEYVARDIEGNTERGTVEAESKKEAAGRLIDRGMFVIEVRETSSYSPSLLTSFEAFFHSRDIMMFCREMSVMVSAGMNIVDCLALLKREAGDEWKRGIIEDMSRDVQNGGSLSEAMKRHPIFSPTLVALVGAGEMSGTLDEILERLAVYTEKRHETREKLITIMAYPFVLLVTMIMVGFFVLSFILPTFAGLFASISAELPLPTRILLGAQEVIVNHGVAVLILALMIPVLIVFMYKKEEYRMNFDRTLLRLPVVGALMSYMETTRLAGTLSVMLSSGIVLDRALTTLSDTTGNHFIRRALLLARGDVQKGRTLSSSLRRWGIFPSSMMELMATGEETGELEMTLGKIEKFCRMEADNMADRLKALAAPTALIIIGGMVGLIVFAIAMPIIDTVTAFS